MLDSENILELKNTWQKTLDHIAVSSEKLVFNTYLKSLKLKNLEEGTLILQAPSDFIIKRVSSDYKPLIVDSWFKTAGDKVSLKLELDQTEQSHLANTVVLKRIAVAKTKNNAPEKTDVFKGSEGDISPKYTFENFIVGNSNQFCHAASEQVSASPGSGYNPLFIYGNAGLGKTHLLQAICNRVAKIHKEKRVVYLSAESFTNILIQCLRAGTMNKFKDELRTADLLIIDDIQFIAGKERTQE